MLIYNLYNIINSLKNYLYGYLCQVLEDAIIDEFMESFKGYYVYCYGRYNKVKIAEHCD